ncbi:MAG: hypothetical protein L0229_03035 [Blastocatellia bacterium]|nr:hypothetical protein [Blastocatellia bacterium]
MLIAIAAMIAVFVLIYFYTGSRKSDSAQLSEPHAPLATIGIQIICGDCSGDSRIPVKTYLNRSGNCDQCGGRSFILASDLALYALQAKAAQSKSRQSLPDRGRVLPFESPASRANRANKIAV